MQEAAFAHFLAGGPPNEGGDSGQKKKAKKKEPPPRKAHPVRASPPPHTLPSVSYHSRQHGSKSGSTAVCR